MTGGFSGGRAQYLRVPLADVNCQVMTDEFTDHQLVFLSDIFPTGYMAAKHCDIKPDDTVAVWGCGPVGQFTIRSALLLGAGKVIAIDNGQMVPERLKMAADAGAVTVDNRGDDEAAGGAAAPQAAPGDAAATAAPGGSRPHRREGGRGAEVAVRGVTHG